ncbi:MAG TPA: hypothetical protein VMZ01_02955 [Aestuariivirga sp.]|nr:hypothetical protein [Aestuariivirga sp.]
MKRLLEYEHHSQPLAPPARFSARLLRNGRCALGIVVVALAIGMAGYMGFEGMGLVDAFANAAMILSGMGPLTPLTTDGGKIFAGLYAIASGLLIFGIAGLVLAPVFHRLMHRFHMEERTPKD